MNKKTRILLIVSIALAALSIGVTFWRAFIGRNYMISFQAICDPSRERCFTQVCTPENPTVNPCKDTLALSRNYKILQMKAYAVPTCDKSNDNCFLLSCNNQPKGAVCTETLCDDVTEMPEGETCNDPETYQFPPTQESVPKIDTSSE